MRILVTGATGFVGRYVVPAIAQRGHIVRGVIRCLPNDSGCVPEPSAGPDSAGGSTGIECAYGDLLRPQTLGSALQNVNAVVNLAISVTANREIQFAETIKGTTNLCEAMVSAGITRIIHCSSRAVYDWTQATQTSDESPPVDAAPQFRDDYA